MAPPVRHPERATEDVHGLREPCSGVDALYFSGRRSFAKRPKWLVNPSRCPSPGSSSSSSLGRSASTATGSLTRPVRRRRTPGSVDALAALRGEQDKLLQAFYKDLIDETLFAREQARIRQEIDNHTHDAHAAASEAVQTLDLAAQFEEVINVLEELNIADLWPYATDAERRILLGELIQHVEIHADRLTVHVHGAPPLNVAPSEVGLKDSGLSRVGRATRTPSYARQTRVCHGPSRRS